jgi:hypothetical protein
MTVWRVIVTHRDTGYSTWYASRANSHSGIYLDRDAAARAIRALEAKPILERYTFSLQYATLSEWEEE